MLVSDHHGGDACYEPPANNRPGDQQTALNVPHLWIREGEPNHTLVTLICITDFQCWFPCEWSMLARPWPPTMISGPHGRLQLPASQLPTTGTCVSQTVIGQISRNKFQVPHNRPCTTFCAEMDGQLHKPHPDGKMGMPALPACMRCGGVPPERLDSCVPTKSVHTNRRWW